MRVVKFIISLVFVILLGNSDIIACTSAIISGKLTLDGKPLMWKHRDTGEENNRVEYFTGEKYDFFALVNSPDITKDAWTGVNEVGFSIMNTASYNLKDDNISVDKMDKEGILMYRALSICKTLKDFEKFLNKYPRPMGVEANFGVIDAQGGAAYYEVNNDSWTKIDVNDPKMAPQGYVCYTNFSYTGRFNEGMGYVRYTTATELINKKIAQGEKITPQWIFKDLSRSFYNSVLGLDLVKDYDLIKRGNGWFIDQDFIPRKSSSASIVIQGVKLGENPDNTIMWTILGYPPVGIAVPLFIAAGEEQPDFMLKSNNSTNAEMCDWVLEKKRKIFGIERGNGDKYLNFKLLYNEDNSGYMQKAIMIEDVIFQESKAIIDSFNKTGFNREKLNNLYGYISKQINL